MNKCRFNKYAPCKGTGVCETCKMPSKYGWFPVLRKMKWTWEQRFILPKDRRERLMFCERQIAYAEGSMVEINDIPSKEEYENGEVK